MYNGLERGHLAPRTYLFLEGRAIEQALKAAVLILSQHLAPLRNKGGRQRFGCMSQLNFVFDRRLDLSENFGGLNCDVRQR